MLPAAGRFAAPLVVAATLGAPLLAAGGLPTSAQAAPVLEVRPEGAVVANDPYLPPRAETDLPLDAGRYGSLPRGTEPSPRRRRAAGAGARARPARHAAVRRAIAKAFESGQITAAERDRWLRAYRSARRTRGRLTGVRRTQLAAVIATLERIARAEQLTASRMPALFLQLERNTEFWPRRPYPAHGQRVVFSGSELVFQHYAGHGLQIQPLANFGKANALWRAERVNRLRLLLDELVAVASRRGRFTTWEYWFAFGGGTPPWMSAMAQGTAIQALSRGSQLLAEPAYLRVARRAIRAFSTRYPVGVRTRGRDGGNHYLIYSFAPGLRVLNAFAQALNGLYDYAVIAVQPRAMELFEKGEVSLRAELSGYDTGAWTLYSLGGAEATLEYHELAADFLGNLCERLGPGEYCDTAARLEGYVAEPPRVALLTSRLVEGNLQYVRFTLSKRSSVRITISRGGEVVHSASATFPYGTRAFGWTPAEPGDYVVTLAAESFASTRGSASGTISVRPKP